MQKKEGPPWNHTDGDYDNVDLVLDRNNPTEPIPDNSQLHGEVPAEVRAVFGGDNQPKTPKTPEEMVRADEDAARFKGSLPPPEIE